MAKNVLLTGATGMDGSNMADYLIKNTDYKIFGGVRRISVPNYNNIEHLIGNPRYELISLDLSDSISVSEAVKKIQPHYLLNFGANSFVGCSWDMPLQVMDVNSNGVIRCLEAIKQYAPTCRFYSAGSSEEFGNVSYSPQDIHHPPSPRSIYGVSKVAARFATKVYKESYNLYAVHGILFNHEGPRRGQEFVTRKITMGVARIRKAIEASLPFKPIELGNLDAKRDWSDSEDFCDGIWRMMNQENYCQSMSVNWPERVTAHIQGEKRDLTDEERSLKIPHQKIVPHIKNYVLSSGEMHSIREFVELAFREIGVEGYWTGQSCDEKYKLKNSDTNLILVNPNFYRPNEVQILQGDSTPIREDLGWAPKISFSELVSRMVRRDMELV